MGGIIRGRQESRLRVVELRCDYLHLAVAQAASIRDDGKGCHQTRSVKTSTVTHDQYDYQQEMRHNTSFSSVGPGYTGSVMCYASLLARTGAPTTSVTCKPDLAAYSLDHSRAVKFSPPGALLLSVGRLDPSPV